MVSPRRLRYGCALESQQSFVLNAKALEVADGEDGFLRGRPDPAVIVAVYAVHGTNTHCMGRSIFRFVPDRSMRPAEGKAIAKQLSFARMRSLCVNAQFERIH